MNSSPLVMILSQNRRRAFVPTLLSAVGLIVLPSLLVAADAPLLVLTNAGSPDHATIIFQGSFPSKTPDKTEEKLVYALHSRAAIQVRADRWEQSQTLDLSILQGQVKELSLALDGDGEITQVDGDGLKTWGVRRGNDSRRSLILQVEPTAGRSNLTFTVKSRRNLSRLPAQFTPLVLSPQDPTFFDGFVQVASGPELDISADNLEGVTPIEAHFFPGISATNRLGADAAKTLTFRFGRVGAQPIGR